jgi:hypothetical protein
MENRKIEPTAEPLSLPQLCTEAADHVARARIALEDRNLDPDRALAHLDDAIGCLQRLRAHGQAGKEEAAAEGARRSA